MGKDPRIEGADHPLAGIWRFALKLTAGTAIAALAAGLGVQVLREGGSASSRAPATAVRDRSVAGAPADREFSARRDRALDGDQADPGPVRTPTAAEIERRYAAGELSEARRSFEPCPGGDVRRAAWMDREGRVLKLVRVRSDGVRVQEWFDDRGRLREALVRGAVAGRAFTRSLSVDESGAELAHEPAGEAVGGAPPPLVRNDPLDAFFAGAGCEGRARPGR
jgi:hypothetical protein